MRQHDAPLIFNGAAAHSPPSDVDLASGINVTVVFTTLEGTRIAVAEADRLAADLGVRITVIVPDVIPYHLPLDRPYLSEGFLRERLESMLAECRAEMRVEICLCRDPKPLLRRWLQSESLVLVGASHRHWHWRESRLRRTLTRMGHDAILVLPPPGRHAAATTGRTSAPAPGCDTARCGPGCD